VSLRTFNRNFCGRSGTVSAQVYLVSPETAAYSALAGVITDPSVCAAVAQPDMPEKFMINDNMVIAPAAEPADVEVVRGPNIKPFPAAKPMAETISGKVLTVLEDNITTDHIMPSNAKLLPYRSNIPYLSEFCLTPSDPDFPQKAKENGGGFIVGGSNYGQGSSREHAALAPLYLGVKAVLAKSFARIHAANLVNNGILPLEFADPADYDVLKEGDEIVIENARAQAAKLPETGIMTVKAAGREITMKLSASERQAKMLLAGGLLNFTREGE